MYRTQLFGMPIDPLTMGEAVARVLRWTDETAAHSTGSSKGKCRFVVTPNADHAVLFQERADLRQAYRAADLVLVDGIPLLLAAKLLHRGVPQRVPGSDLVPALFETASHAYVTSLAGHERPPLRVFLLGAASGVAERAAEQIHNRWPGVHVVGCYSPPLGFEKIDEYNDAILDRIAAAKCDLLVVGLGAPKQELWVSRHRERIAARVALCVGATIDFLAGEKRRAPIWMRRTGLEWLHRMASEPGRLAGRYLRDAIHLPRLMWQEIRAGLVGRAASPSHEEQSAH